MNKPYHYCNTEPIKIFQRLDLDFLRLVFQHLALLNLL